MRRPSGFEPETLGSVEFYSGGVRGGFEEDAVEAAFAEVGVSDQTRRSC